MLFRPLRSACIVLTIAAAPQRAGAWAIESYWIMRTPATGYLGNPGNLTFGEVYVAQNKLTAMEQIEKAGLRLSHLLNRAFGDPGASLPIPSLPVD